jgi:hypothetical protein
MCVTAAMRIAWLWVRFPRRDSRCTVRPPEFISIGAVRCRRLMTGGRESAYVAAQPITIAATIDPTPYRSVNVVADATTASVTRGFAVFSRAAGGRADPPP